MRILFQILGTDTGDISPSCLILFEQESYLFNCGEGTQRLCIQYKVRMTKITNIFFTSLKWEDIGGFAGYSLTLSDMLIGRLKALREIQKEKDKRKELLQKEKEKKKGGEMVDEDDGKEDMVDEEEKEEEIDNVGLSVIGPKNTSNYISSLRYFVNRKELVYNVKECHSNDEEPIKKKDLTVTPIVLFKDNDPRNDLNLNNNENNTNNNTNDKEDKIENNNVDLPPEKETELSRGRILQKNDKTHEIAFNLAFIYPESQKKKRKNEEQKETKEPLKTKRSPEHPIERIVPSTKPDDTIVCYLCQTSDIPGKFDAKKAKELKVPEGPLRAKLTKGESIQLPNSDVIIHPQDVIGAPQPGTIFLIAACPSLEYVNSLTENKKWEQYINSPTNSISMIIHMTPQSVIDSEKYQQWMKKFGNNCKHVIVNKESCPQKPNFTSASKANFKLNHVYPELFPLVKTLPKPSLTSPLFKEKNVFVGDNLLGYLLSPKLQWEKKDIEKFVFNEKVGKECVQELQKDPLFNEAVKKFQLVKSKEREVYKELGLKTPFNELEIVFLGTGAALPSLHRNVTGCVVDFGNVSFMLDCGEGSWGQMVRRYGIEDAEKVLKKMKFVFVSHNHADHHLGLSRILKHRERVLGREENEKDPLIVIGPTWINFFLTEHSEVEDLTFTFINADELTDKVSTNKLLTDLKKRCGIEEMGCVEVIHCPFAYAFAVKHQESGFKLVYSGDTRPSEELAILGKDSHVLIHEATFEPHMEHMAVMKRHSTTSEAMDIGIKMQAKYTVLFHFSQRYPKLPSFVKEGFENDPYVDNTGLAFDLMSLKISNLPLMSSIIPLIQFIFPPEEENEENN